MPYDALFQPLEAPGLDLPHRIALGPLTRNRAKGTVPGEMNAEYYGQRATAALTITEGSHPAPEGQGYLDIAGMYTEGHEEGWRLVAERVHEGGGRLWVQIMHCGRVAHPRFTDGRTPVAPSAVKSAGTTWSPEGDLEFVTPRALKTDELPGLIGDYVQAAERAVRAGADGIELHSANGYLLHQFLGTNTNTRTDGYGTDVAGRIRFVVEVARACADAIGPERVGIRISPGHEFGDMQEDDVEETYEALIPALADIGLAYLHVLEPEDADLPRIRQARRLWPGVLMGNAGFAETFDLDRAAELVADGTLDVVAYGRLFLANPDLPERLRTGAELNEPDPDTFYGGDAEGYTDYPALTESAAA